MKRAMKVGTRRKGRTIARGKRTQKAGPAPSSTTLSERQVATILKHLRSVGSVELKVIVPVTTHHATVASVGLDPVEAQPRQAYFFDTPDLALSKAGLVVRARRIQGGGADTVIKLRPVDPTTIDPELRRSGSFKVELDAMPGGFVCSASLRGTCTGQDVLDVTSGVTPLRSLFSKEQLAFYDEHAAGISMESLVTLGPTFLLKAKHDPRNFNRRITLEMWLYPDGSRILELSTKCLPQEAFQTAAEFKAYLANCGIKVVASDETKTRAAMEYFRSKLAAGQPEA